jgi:hypothetical protein
VGWCMPLAYVLRSAIGRGLRRTGCGQERTFDVAARIADNLAYSLRVLLRPTKH